MATLLVAACLLLTVVSGAALWSCRRSRHALMNLDQQVREAEAMSRHCPVTGLANRTRLVEWLERRIAEGRARPAVICFRFKPFGPGIEREAGLVRRISEVCVHIFPEEALLARLGSGCYVIALGGAIGTGELVTVTRAACALLGSLVSDAERLRVGVSLATGSDCAATLIERAFEAQDAAGSHDPVSLTFSDPELDDEIAQRTAAARELEAAIAQGRIEPFFQPFVELGSGRILGFEVLARWRAEDGHVRMPGEFLPLAEESGLVGPMYESLLGAAAAEAGDWPPEWKFALNISGSQLTDEGLVARTIATLSDADIDPGRLEIEIAESALSADPERALAIIEDFRTRGVLVTLDNFGSGNLHLRDLARFTFDRIKVDPSAIADGEDGDAGSALGLVAATARHLGIPVLAQGLETHAGAEAAQLQGCAIGQGFLFGRPDRKTECFRLDGVLARASEFAA